MVKEKRDFNWKMEEVRERLLSAMLLEVIFDGWSAQAFQHAIKAEEIDPAYAHLAFPKGAIDVAVYMHKKGDEEMRSRLGLEAAGIQGFSAKIEYAINLRLEIAGAHKDAVARATSLFAFPQNAALGSKLIWGTTDAIWDALGDQSTGFTYYSKRSSLSAVYSSSLLYWLQDQSEDMQATREFVHRRIQDVGRFGKFTAKFKRTSA